MGRGGEGELRRDKEDVIMVVMDTLCLVARCNLIHTLAEKSFLTSSQLYSGLYKEKRDAAKSTTRGL